MSSTYSAHLLNYISHASFEATNILSSLSLSFSTGEISLIHWEGHAYKTEVLTSKTGNDFAYSDSSEIEPLFFQSFRAAAKSATI